MNHHQDIEKSNVTRYHPCNVDFRYIVDFSYNLVNLNSSLWITLFSISLSLYIYIYIYIYIYVCVCVCVCVPVPYSQLTLDTAQCEMDI